jgi:hypothetical protein
MPTYLVHGFRWSRQSIRIHILLHNLEDAAAEWIVAPATSITLLNSFYTLFDFLPPSSTPKSSFSSASGSNQTAGSAPASAITDGVPIAAAQGLVGESPEVKDKLLNRRKSGKLQKLKTSRSRKSLRSLHVPDELTPPLPSALPEFRENFNNWSAVKLLEQYDPEDLSAGSQPYAYVADYMVPVDLSVDVTKEIERYDMRMREERGELDRGESPVWGRNESVRLSTVGPLSPISPGEEDGVLGQKMSLREMRRKSKRLGWFEKLRDSLQKGGDIGWYIVVCGDEERNEGLEEDLDDYYEVEEKMPRSAGIRGFFRRGHRSNGSA